MPLDEDEVGCIINDGRADVARALVETIYGTWRDQPPYTELYHAIIDDPYHGVSQALRMFQLRLNRAKRKKK